MSDVRLKAIPLKGLFSIVRFYSLLGMPFACIRRSDFLNPPVDYQKRRSFLWNIDFVFVNFALNIGYKFDNLIIKI